MTQGPKQGVGAILAVVLFASLVSAQGVSVRRLGPADGRLGTEFSGLNSVIELPDGRILLTDAIDNRIVVADFKTNRVSLVGRNGPGPGEYRRALPLTPLGADSSLMIDVFGRRWQILVGAKLSATLPPDHALLRAVGNATLVMASRKGDVMTVRNGNVATDSQTMSLIPWSGEGAVIIGRLAPPVPGSRGLPPPWSEVWDSPSLAPDGWIAVLRVRPHYSVDWRSPNGKWVHGAPLPGAVVRVTATEKAFYMERLAAVNGGKPQSASTIQDWPDQIPPVNLLSPIRFGPEGELLVLRMRTATQRDLVYDVLNRKGGLNWRLQLNLDQRILGTGRRGIYVVTTDGDGIQHLSRHKWPG